MGTVVGDGGCVVRSEQGFEAALAAEADRGAAFLKKPFVTDKLDGFAEPLFAFGPEAGRSAE